MKNFKQIAEDCLAGKLSGTFVIDKGKNWHSSYLQRHTTLGREMPGQYVLGPGVIYNEIGQCEGRERVRIIDFIPDNMKEQIKIDIPEGKVPVMEQTEKGVIITWKEKELTYTDVSEKLSNDRKYIGSFGYSAMSPNLDTDAFYKKVEVLRKLTNIRNYFGKPTKDIGYVVIMGTVTETSSDYRYLPVFDTKEHAEQAIKMLGDELKHLFEPW